MDNQMELAEMQEMFEVVRQLLGYTGDIMMQVGGVDRFVEQRGIDAILKYVESGGRAYSEVIRGELADAFELNLKDARVAYAAFEVTAKDGQKQRLYLFRGKDRDIVRDVIRDMEVSLERMRQEPVLDILRRDIDRVPDVPGR